ncbi:hypothetical protein EV424DRAFT_1344402 [Suillus variegatus]|nr:hypothetical protein EV424DRAFT_1344402 [Suillus variegatus]
MSVKLVGTDMVADVGGVAAAGRMMGRKKEVLDFRLALDSPTFSRHHVTIPALHSEGLCRWGDETISKLLHLARVYFQTGAWTLSLWTDKPGLQHWGVESTEH